MKSFMGVILVKREEAAERRHREKLESVNALIGVLKDSLKKDNQSFYNAFQSKLCEVRTLNLIESLYFGGSCYAVKVTVPYYVNTYVLVCFIGKYWCSIKLVIAILSFVFMSRY